MVAVIIPELPLSCIYNVCKHQSNGCWCKADKLMLNVLLIVAGVGFYV